MVSLPSRLILVTLLVVLGSSGVPAIPAQAEWVEIGPSNDGTAVFYVDPKTVRRNGHFVKLWQLHDYKAKRSSQPRASIKVLFEFDCEEARKRLVAGVSYSDNMGRGQANVIKMDMEETKWERVTPESLGESLWKAACTKKF